MRTLAPSLWELVFTMLGGYRDGDVEMEDEAEMEENPEETALWSALDGAEDATSADVPVTKNDRQELILIVSGIVILCQL